MLILPETDVNGAELVLARLKIIGQKTPMVHDEQFIPVTFSAGLAQRHPEENGHALVLRADGALLQAKEAGRNCVRIAS